MKMVIWKDTRSLCNFLEAFGDLFTVGKDNKESLVCQVDAQRSGGLWKRKPGSQSALECGSLERDSLQHADTSVCLKCPGIPGSALILLMQVKGPTSLAMLGRGSGIRAVKCSRVAFVSPRQVWLPCHMHHVRIP